MMEIKIDNLTKSAFNAFEILAISLSISIFIWYAQFHWKRRHLYKAASKFHGPLALPFIGCAYIFLGPPEKVQEKIMMLTRKYPGVVRFWFGSKLFFAIQEPKDIEIVFNNSKTLGKEEMIYKFLENGLGQGLFTAQVSTWKSNRKMINPTFNQKNLDSFVEVFAEHTAILLENLKKYCGKGEFDIFKEISNCTLDIIAETAMGIKLNAQTSHCEFGEWLDRLMEVIFKRMSIILYQFDFIYKFTNCYKIETEYVEKCKNFTSEVVRKQLLDFRKRNKEKDDDFEKVRRRQPFLESLIQLTYEGHAISENQLRDEVNTFVVAGSDTTATENTFTLLALAMFPDIQHRVFEEVIEVVGADRDVETADLPKLKYLERVIKETLRVFPVSVFLARKNSEDIKLNSHIIPANSSFLLATHAVHMNEKYWPDPYKFNPDRFLPEEAEKRHPFAYLPFGAGPRNCIGPKYAMMAMKSLLAAVVRKYEFSTTYKKIEDVHLKSHVVLRPCNGYKISIRTR